jgi:ribonucleoside-diphosphate reductase alpha chain
MQVVKRDGRREIVQFDKITQRLRTLCNAGDASQVDALQVDVLRVAASACAAVHDGITTCRLDELTADTAAGMATDHPDYGELAARILVSNLQKNTSADVAGTYERMGELLSDEFLAVARAHAEELQAMVDYSRDYKFDYFAFRTLEKMYLTRVDGVIVERPQHMWLRVALTLWEHDMVKVRETYEHLSTHQFIHASPTLFNAGMKHQQLASCFLLGAEEDSLDGIFEGIAKCAKISKHGGGIGFHVTGVRAKGSVIRGTNGQSDGLVPMLRVINAVAAYVNQGGRRKGSIAIYIEPHHPDFIDVVSLRRNAGDEHLRARDLFYAAFLSDIFMRRVEAGGTWSFFDPAACPGLADAWGDTYSALYERYEAEGLAVRQMPAQDVFFELLKSLIETGTPFVQWKDACNAKSNQQNLGTIRCSNLCVSGATRVLTSTGQHPIAELVGQNVAVWNGERFSETTVTQTGTNQKLLTVTLDNGAELQCTPYHKFYVESASRPAHTSRPVVVKAADLNPGDRVVKFDLPTLLETECPARDPRDAYTQGFFSADGYYAQDRARISVSRSDKKAALKARANYTHARDYTMSDETVRTTFVLGAAHAFPKFEVPINAAPAEKLRWLEGYMDGDGTVVHNDGIENLQASSISKEFLNDVRLMLQTLGVNSTATFSRPAGTALLPDGHGGLATYNTQDLWRLNIGSAGLRTLTAMGFAPSRIAVTGGRAPHHDTCRFTRVVSVEDHGITDDTYCFNEPLRHAGVFEGVLTGQCTEILEFTSPEEVAVCNLASLNLPAFVRDGAFDFEGLMAATRIVARNLDRVIDKTWYPLEEARTSNLRHRPIGIGVQGLADVFMMLRMPFDSAPARDLNRAIFESLYYAAISESCELAKAAGPYSSFAGSPASQGRLQFDLWGDRPTATQWDWDQLKADVTRHGLRNSLSVAPMPTASTSNILGNYECIEPALTNAFSRKTLAGEFIVVNKHLIRDLVRHGLWTASVKDAILANEGSVLGVPGVPEDIQELYKTAWQLSMKAVIDMAADRGPFICQSQSLNLFVAEPTYKKLSSMYFYAWRKGLKTTYYLRTKAAGKAVQVTLNPDYVGEVKDNPKDVEEDPEECLACSG